MGIMVRERAAQESALMEQRRGGFLCGALQPEPQLPCGWEKCLDLKVCMLIQSTISEFLQFNQFGQEWIHLETNVVAFSSWKLR